MQASGEAAAQRRLGMILFSPHPTISPEETAGRRRGCLSVTRQEADKAVVAGVHTPRGRTMNEGDSWTGSMSAKPPRRSVS